jgi:hypothetical protein
MLGYTNVNIDVHTFMYPFVYPSYCESTILVFNLLRILSSELKKMLISCGIVG